MTHAAFINEITYETEDNQVLSNIFFFRISLW